MSVPLQQLLELCPTKVLCLPYQLPQNLLKVPLTDDGGSRVEPRIVEKTGVDTARWLAREGG
jgi:hypothetical protein